MKLNTKYETGPMQQFLPAIFHLRYPPCVAMPIAIGNKMRSAKWRVANG